MPGSGTVLITGASTGIGRASALRLDAHGFDVVAGVRRAEDGESLRSEASPRLRTEILDITDQSTIDAVAETLDGDALAGLVNNAGIAVGGPLEYVPMEDFRRQLDVNLLGTFAVTKALLPKLRATRGRIVNIGSVGGRNASPFLGPYSVSKYGVEAFTDSLRQELRPWGMQVAVVEPGAIATPMWDKGRQTANEYAEQLPSTGRELYGGAVLAMQRTTEQMARRAVPPEKVARAVEHALTARRARARYVVGLDARAQLALKALLPTRAMDGLVARVMGL
jgi:NAD(P)-dependent dehydrogenase (short-subunit alcohol dehydrogenase family)